VEQDVRILWFSNRPLSDEDVGSTGTWLQAMAQCLVGTGQVQLGNVSRGRVPGILRQDWGPVQQWIVPVGEKPQRDGLPASKVVDAIARVVREFSPDLIHIWGTEYYWGLLTARRLIPGPTLLEMQGLKFVWARVFAGGLSCANQLACIGLKECLRRSSLFQLQRRFERWGIAEREMISKHRYISVQSPWMKAHIKAINSQAQTFEVDLALRDAFYRGRRWEWSDKMRVFCSSANPFPYKGLHVAVRAIALLKKTFPAIQLRIAGYHRTSGFRQDGYIAWVDREIRRLGLQQNVVWLGPLDADQIVAELVSSSAMVVPSYVESYCVALCEAMMVGVPTVASFNGGTAYLTKNEESSLHFLPGEVEMCAHQLSRLLTDRALAVRVSENAYKAAVARNDPNRLVCHQIEIYRSVLKDPAHLAQEGASSASSV
jgi:glycosyltransferase involved in cell wall biosynthesis